MTTQELIEWQKDLRSQPKVWWVEAWCDGVLEPTGSMYVDKEGAELELAWITARKRRGRVMCENLHTTDLARRRWGAGGNSPNDSRSATAEEARREH